MSAPIRIQLSRRKGWRMPANTVKVSRPGRFSNPYRIGDAHPVTGAPISRDDAVALHREMVEDPAGGFDLRREIRAELAGKDLACWCKPNEACHADTLLKIANGARHES